MSADENEETPRLDTAPFALPTYSLQPQEKPEPLPPNLPPAEWSEHAFVNGWEWTKHDRGGAPMKYSSGLLTLQAEQPAVASLGACAFRLSASYTEIERGARDWAGSRQHLGESSPFYSWPYPSPFPRKRELYADYAPRLEATRGSGFLMYSGMNLLPPSTPSINPIPLVSRDEWPNRRLETRGWGTAAAQTIPARPFINPRRAGKPSRLRAKLLVSAAIIRLWAFAS